MKKLQVLFSIMLAFLLIFSITGGNLVFAKDHENHEREGEVMQFEDSNQAVWAKDYISSMISKNIFQGYNDGSFRPNKSLSRVEAIVTAVRLMGLEDEAKAKNESQEGTLYFKDAKIFENGHKYSWARGYIVVALENGLFDSSENMIQPQKAASRVWVASILIRALGLQSEAQDNMTAPLEFKDANSIPAGSIGYVKVAVDRGLITGYADGTFRPNKPVTRAEMAALLDRTNDVLLEDSGATTVMGKVTDIGFDQSVTDEVYGSTSVTDEVYGQANGFISIESFTGEPLSYSISSELQVQYHERFITADQLLIDDLVSLVVKDDNVVEATLLDDENVDANISAIREFKIELEGKAGEYKLSYKNSKGRIRAEIKTEDDGNRITGQEAIDGVESIINQLDLKPDMDKEELKANILSAIQVEEQDVQKMEVKIVFADGKELKIESEDGEMDKESREEEQKGEREEGENQEDQNQNDEGNNGTLDDNSSNINDFELKITFNNHRQGYWSYETEEGEVKAYIQDGYKRIRGEEAINDFDQLLDNMALTSETTEEEALEAILTSLNIDKENIRELKLEVKFSNDNKLEVNYKNGNERNHGREDD